MCKTCCQGRRSECAYAGHRDSTPIAAANGNPSSLARPPAVVPASSSSSSSASSLPIDNATLDVRPKIYSKSMDEAWASQLKSRLAEQQKRKDAEDQKRLKLRRVQNEIGVCFFSEDDVEPERLRDQSVSSCPYFNLARSATLLRKMKLDTTDEFGLYDYRSGLWNREDVDTTLQVTSGQTLLIRRVSVTRCTGIDKMIALYAPAHKSGRWLQLLGNRSLTTNATHRIASPSRSSSPFPSPSSSSPFPLPSALLTRRATPTTPSHAKSSVIDLSLSPSPSPTAVRRRVPSASPHVRIKREATSTSADHLRREGSVLVLSGLESWPAGIYAQDMVWAFGQISCGRGTDGDIGSRFEKVFPGVKFVKATYSRQLQFPMADIDREAHRLYEGVGETGEVLVERTVIVIIDNVGH
ncbi:hypothetical protein DFH06DRAFT_1141161 [Mycena polygramma]|nr:hypothetical protein DFH06DRAFT_1141161 [Mycena polygramma]